MAIAGHSGQFQAELLQGLSPPPNCRRKRRGASFNEWESSSDSPQFVGKRGFRPLTRAS